MSVYIKPYNDLKFFGFDFSRLRKKVDHDGQVVVKKSLYTSNKDLIRQIEQKYLDEKLDNLLTQKIKMELVEKRRENKIEANVEQQGAETEVRNSVRGIGKELDDLKKSFVAIPKLNLDAIKEGDSGVGEPNVDKAKGGSGGSGLASSCDSSLLSTEFSPENPWNYGKYDPQTAREKIENIRCTPIKVSSPSMVGVQFKKGVPRMVDLKQQQFTSMSARAPGVSRPSSNIPSKRVNRHRRVVHRGGNGSTFQVKSNSAMTKNSIEDKENAIGNNPEELELKEKRAKIKELLIQSDTIENVKMFKKFITRGNRNTRLPAFMVELEKELAAREGYAEETTRTTIIDRKTLID